MLGSENRFRSYLFIFRDLVRSMGVLTSCLILLMTPISNSIAGGGKGGKKKKEEKVGLLTADAAGVEDEAGDGAGSLEASDPQDGGLGGLSASALQSLDGGDGDVAEEDGLRPVDSISQVPSRRSGRSGPASVASGAQSEHAYDGEFTTFGGSSEHASFFQAVDHQRPFYCMYTVDREMGRVSKHHTVRNDDDMDLARTGLTEVFAAPGARRAAAGASAAAESGGDGASGAGVGTRVGERATGPACDDDEEDLICCGFPSWFSRKLGFMAGGPMDSGVKWAGRLVDRIPTIGGAIYRRFHGTSNYKELEKVYNFYFALGDFRKSLSHYNNLRDKVSTKKGAADLKKQMGDVKLQIQLAKASIHSTASRLVKTPMVEDFLAAKFVAEEADAEEDEDAPVVKKKKFFDSRLKRAKRRFRREFKDDDTVLKFAKKLFLVFHGRDEAVNYTSEEPREIQANLKKCGITKQHETSRSVVLGSVTPRKVDVYSYEMVDLLSDVATAYTGLQQDEKRRAAPAQPVERLAVKDRAAVPEGVLSGHPRRSSLSQGAGSRLQSVAQRVRAGVRFGRRSRTGAYRKLDDFSSSSDGEMLTDADVEGATSSGDDDGEGDSPRAAAAAAAPAGASAADTAAAGASDGEVGTESDA